MTDLFTLPLTKLRKAYEESEHPRDARGRWSSAGGKGTGQHLIVDNATGKVVGSAQTLGGAMRAAERRNKRYGAHRFHTVDQKTYNLRQQGWPDDDR